MLLHLCKSGWHVYKMKMTSDFGFFFFERFYEIQSEDFFQI